MMRLGVAPGQLGLRDEGCAAVSNGSHYTLSIEFEKMRLCQSRFNQSQGLVENMVKIRPPANYLYNELVDDEDSAIDGSSTSAMICILFDLEFTFHLFYRQRSIRLRRGETATAAAAAAATAFAGHWNTIFLSVQRDDLSSIHCGRMWLFYWPVWLLAIAITWTIFFQLPTRRKPAAAAELLDGSNLFTLQLFQSKSFTQAFRPTMLSIPDDTYLYGQVATRLFLVSELVFWFLLVILHQMFLQVKPNSSTIFEKAVIYSCYFDSGGQRSYIIQAG